MKEIQHVGILGLGLIGGSVAKALKRSKKDYFITAWDQDKLSLQMAYDDKMVDAIAESPIKDFQQCDILFFCVPVYAMKDLLVALLPYLKESCLITDVGSTKGDVMALIQDLGISQRFIGGHPMAGSEKTGYQAAKANLFENAYYCLASASRTAEAKLPLLKSLILDMGAIPIEMSPDAHDRVTASISHVPHVIAALLVNMVGSLDGPENYMKTIAAGGFKDITRIASSSPELWAGICLSNQEIILETLTYIEDSLRSFKQDLANRKEAELQDFFRMARELRGTFSERKSLIQKTFDILVDVEDKPGIIAVIASALAQQNINIKNIGIINNRETEEGALEIQFENEESQRKGIIALSALGYKAKEKG